MIIAAAAVLAGFGAAWGPWVIARLPEPAEPAADKVAYATLATRRGLAPVGALVAAAVAGSLAWRAEEPGALGVWVTMAVLGVWLSFIDWHTKLLPYAMVAPGYAVVVPLLGLAAWVDEDWSRLVHAGFGAAGVFAFYFLSWLVFRRSIGYGDVRLSGLIGASLGYVGLAATLVGVWAGFAVGAVAGIALVSLKRFSRTAFPFGPAMFAGWWIGLLLYL